MHNILPLHEFTIRMSSASLMSNTKWNTNINSTSLIKYFFIQNAEYLTHSPEVPLTRHLMLN